MSITASHVLWADRRPAATLNGQAGWEMWSSEADRRAREQGPGIATPVPPAQTGFLLFLLPPGLPVPGNPWRSTGLCPNHRGENEARCTTPALDWPFGLEGGGAGLGHAALPLAGWPQAWAHYLRGWGLPGHQASPSARSAPSSPQRPRPAPWAYRWAQAELSPGNSFVLAARRLEMLLQAASIQSGPRPSPLGPSPFRDATPPLRVLAPPPGPAP